MKNQITSEYFNTPFWQDRFHWCAFVAYLTAQAEGKHLDLDHVQKLAYENYEKGELTI